MSLDGITDQPTLEAPTTFLRSMRCHSSKPMPASDWWHNSYANTDDTCPAQLTRMFGFVTSRIMWCMLTKAIGAEPRVSPIGGMTGCSATFAPTALRMRLTRLGS